MDSDDTLIILRPRQRRDQPRQPTGTLRLLLWAVVFVLGLCVPMAAFGKQPSSPVDLNRATLDELMKLPGIGKLKAEAIVRHRQARPFARPSDLMRVRGFGRGTYRRVKPYIVIGSPAAVVDPKAPAT